MTKIFCWQTMSLDDILIYSFFLGFLGFLDLDLALQRGQMGALRWICWWQERQDFIGGGCCLETSRMISLTRVVQKLDENELSDSAWNSQSASVSNKQNPIGLKSELVSCREVCIRFEPVEQLILEHYKDSSEMASSRLV